MVDFEVVDSFPPATFTPAPDCAKRPVFAGCRAEAARAMWQRAHATAHE